MLKLYYQVLKTFLQKIFFSYFATSMYTVFTVYTFTEFT